MIVCCKFSVGVAVADGAGEVVGVGVAVADGVGEVVGVGVKVQLLLLLELLVVDCTALTAEPPP
jgi:hypothetical protein